MIENTGKDYNDEWYKYFMNKSSGVIYKDFIKAIEANDNATIEKNVVYKTLCKIASSDNELKDIIPKNTPLYRARLVYDRTELLSEDDNFYGYSEYESKEAPLGVSNEGRCNILGMSYLYVAESEYAACAELRPNYLETISVARFKTKENLNIVDMKTDKVLSSLRQFGIENGFAIGGMITFLRLQLAGGNGIFRAYKISQYIADFFRKAGFDGVKYKSSQTGEASYVIFNSYEGFIKFDESRLFVTDRAAYNFIKFSDSKRIEGKIDEISDVEFKKMKDAQRKENNFTRSV